MRFPWQDREDEARKQRITAQRRLAGVEANWPKVLKQTGELTYERRLNGWTAILAELFADHRRDSP